MNMINLNPIERVRKVSNIESLISKYGVERAAMYCTLRYECGFTNIFALRFIRNESNFPSHAQHVLSNG